MHEIYDILIVGAGPAGALTGSLLSKAGYKVLILDGAKEVKRKVCGEYLCPLGVDLVKQLDLEHLIQDFHQINGMNIFSPRGQIVRSLFPDTNKKNYGISLNRQVFDQRIIDMAIENGATLINDSAVAKFEYQGSYWSVSCVNQRKYNGRLLIGADGRRSLIAKTIGASKKSNNQKRVAIHCWLKRKFDFERVGQMHLFKDSSYIGIDPISNDELNVSLVCDAKVIKEFGGPLAVLNHYIEKSKFLHQSIGHVREGERIFTVSPITHELDKYQISNLVLVGDAAGFIDPLTGEGIFNALWMAKALSCEIIERKLLLNFNSAIRAYNIKKNSFFRQKKVTNFFFQWLIRKYILVEIVAKFLKTNRKRADSFVGIIGNVYSPLKGLIKMVF